nr:immunoglobulin heavy chain junction region [Macaca mulatta]
CARDGGSSMVVVIDQW